MVICGLINSLFTNSLDGETENAVSALVLARATHVNIFLPQIGMFYALYGMLILYEILFSLRVIILGVARLM